MVRFGLLKHYLKTMVVGIGFANKYTPHSFHDFGKMILLEKNKRLHAWIYSWRFTGENLHPEGLQKLAKL